MTERSWQTDIVQIQYILLCSAGITCIPIPQLVTTILAPTLHSRCLKGHKIDGHLH